MTWAQADAVLTALEQEAERWRTSYPTEALPVVVLGIRQPAVRLDDVIAALRFYRRGGEE